MKWSCSFQYVIVLSAVFRGATGFRCQNQSSATTLWRKFQGIPVIGLDFFKGNNELFFYRGSNLMKSQNPTMTAYAVRSMTPVISAGRCGRFSVRQGNADDDYRGT